MEQFVASVKTVGLIVGSVAVATLSFGLAFAADPMHAAVKMATASAPVVKAHLVRVTGADFTFDAPDVIPCRSHRVQIPEQGTRASSHAAAEAHGRKNGG
jgi:hypothetical protein